MSSIFPSFKETLDETKKANILPIFEEHAWNFNTDEPILSRNNELIKLEKNKALEVWCYFALKTYRNRFLAYTCKYGSKLEDLIGNNYEEGQTDNEVTQMVEECLLVSPYILSIDTVEIIDFTDSTLSIDITMTTIYGELEMKYSAT